MNWVYHLNGLPTRGEVTCARVTLTATTLARVTLRVTLKSPSVWEEANRMATTKERYLAEIEGGDQQGEVVEGSRNRNRQRRRRGICLSQAARTHCVGRKWASRRQYPSRHPAPRRFGHSGRMSMNPHEACGTYIFNVDAHCACEDGRYKGSPVKNWNTCSSHKASPTTAELIERLTTCTRSSI